MTMQRKTGTVKWFKDGKGYGFIVDDDGGPDVYVHYSDISGDAAFRSLTEGERVEFSLFASGVKGPKAVDVLRI